MSGRRGAEPCGNADIGFGRFHMQRADSFSQRVHLTMLPLILHKVVAGQALVTIIVAPSVTCRGGLIAMLVSDMSRELT